MKVWTKAGGKVVFVAELVLEGHDLAVVDVANGNVVSLSELFRTYRENAEQTEMGRVRITIEPDEGPPPRR